MRFKDILALSILALVSFPVVLLGVLFWTGNVRLAMGPDKVNPPNVRERLQQRIEDLHAPGVGRTESTKDGTQVQEAVMHKEAELDKREAEMLRESQRLTQLRREVDALRNEIHADRVRIESLLSGNDSLENQRMTILANTFVGMKPAQAAPVLLALDDVLAVGILRRVKDDRPRARLLAGLARLDNARTAKLTRLLGTASPPSKAVGKEKS